MKTLLASMTSLLLVLFSSASDAQSSLSESLAFIQSRLTPVAMNGGLGRWTPSDFEASGSILTWVENLVRIDASGIVSTWETYSVDVRYLIYPVSVENSNVLFECKSTKCISVSMKEIIVSAGAENPNETEVVEKRPSNNWHFPDSNTAQRVAKAMNDAFRILGASSKSY